MIRESRFTLGRGLLLIGAVLLATAALFEVYLRVSGFLAAMPASYPCVGGDAVLNHTFTPGCRGVARAQDLKTAADATYEVNGSGFRGADFQVGKETMVVLGDSYTEGFGLNESDTFPAALERALGMEAWQLLNGGVLGYSPALYPAYFERYFLGFRPRLVLLNLDLTDFSDEGYWLQLAEFDARGLPIAFPPREVFWHWLLGAVYSNSSALLRFLHQELNALSRLASRSGAEARMDRMVAGRDEFPLQVLEKSGRQGCKKVLEAIGVSILRLEKSVRAVGGKLALHMYPSGDSIKKYSSRPSGLSFVAAWDQSHRKDFSWACAGGADLVPLMRHFSTSHGIPFFESFSFINAQKDRDALYFDRDAHWNAEGVRRVTVNLARSLRPLLLK